MIAVVTRETHSRDYWTAEAGAHAAGGPGPGEALGRLCRVLNVPATDILPVQDGTSDRKSFRLGPTKPCEECRGSGTYVGLKLREPCRMCGGCGRVPA
jgi:hypothetical protein